jgi:hypothetical protein
VILSTQKLWKPWFPGDEDPVELWFWKKIWEDVGEKGQVTGTEVKERFRKPAIRFNKDSQN